MSDQLALNLLREVEDQDPCLAEQNHLYPKHRVVTCCPQYYTFQGCHLNNSPIQNDNDWYSEHCKLKQGLFASHSFLYQLLVFSIINNRNSGLNITKMHQKRLKQAQELKPRIEDFVIDAPTPFTTCDLSEPQTGKCRQKKSTEKVNHVLMLRQKVHCASLMLQESFGSLSSAIYYRLRLLLLIQNDWLSACTVCLQLVAGGVCANGYDVRCQN